MSQKGSLSENELIEQVQKYFDIKLDRDALAKPSGDVVQEIYRRFLEQVHKNWMKPNNAGIESMPLARKLYWMRVICRSFEFDFSMYDLVRPSKRRTTDILHIILYVRAMYDECFTVYQQIEDKKARKREENEEICREIANYQAKTEEYALRIGQSKPIDQLRAEIKEHDQVLRVQKRECDELEREKAMIKERIKKKEEGLTRQRIEKDEIQKKIEDCKRRQEYASKISSVQEEISLTQNALQQLKIQNDLKRAEEDHQCKLIEDDEKEFMVQIKEEIQRSQLKIMACKDERAMLKKKSEDDISWTDEAIRMARQDVEELKESYLRTKTENEREIKSILQDYKIKLNNLIGIPTEIDGPKNRTFIKSKNDE